MLRTLLTPLRARFDVSPRLPPQNTLSVPQDEPTPEDFARDVLVELMRNSVEELKQAEGHEDKIKIVAEIQRIMNQNSYTKDVFRELDGFLVIYNVLSTLTDSSEDEDRAAKRLEGVRSTLGLLSDATFEHDRNATFYKRVIGYEPLKHSLENVSSDPETTITVLGLLLSFILHEPALEPLFRALQAANIDEVDDVLVQYGPHLQTIHHPGALPLLWSLIQRVWTFPSLRFGCSKILGRLAAARHRNFAVMSNAGLVLPILEHLLSSKGNGEISDSERHTWQKLLRRLLELGAAPPQARLILQRVIREDDTLDAEMLDLVRYGMRSRWVDHFSMESSSALVITDEDSKGLPSTGVTFMVWIFLSQLPSLSPLTLLEVSADKKSIISLLLRSDGKFELRSNASREAVIFTKATIRKSRWTHLALVHYPSRSSNPSLRLFVDAVIQDAVNIAYPKPDTKCAGLSYRIGNGTTGHSPSWCLSSAYLIAAPIHDDIVRFIHHIGPRYIGNFQDSDLKRFLTYEASTSVNMFLASLKSKNGLKLEESPILKIVRNGIGFNKSQMVFSINAASVPLAGFIEEAPSSGLLMRFMVKGDVYLAKAACFDNALWTIGGAAVVLRLVQLAMSPHELSRALSILVDGLRNSWQNSEDMERLRGYEILADILRKKSHHINLTSYEILFEFLGINARTPEQSTIVNLGAYGAIALDFELWSRTRDEIQAVYFEHFSTLFKTSRYRAYNITQRFSKLRLTRKLVFALQTDWFSANNTTRLINALRIACRADFSRDGTIKPVVSYLAANLHEVQEVLPASSPRSIYSRVDFNNARDKSEKVFALLVDMLSDEQYYTKFVATLPLTRICLLLIGFSASFIRKFELVNGWNVLKTIVPGSWNAEVNGAAFKLLIGRATGQQKGLVIKCPQIVPTILTALQSGLSAIASTVHISDEARTPLIESPLSPLRSGLGSQCFTFPLNEASTVEALVEELLNLHSTVAQFRTVFQSQITTQLFVDGYKAFVKRLSVAPAINARALRILEKLTHFGLALALDNLVAGSQKREIMDTIPIAEGILSPDVERTTIDPSLVADTRTVRQRLASARFSLQVRERTIIKIVTRIAEWRKTVQISEEKRLRKAFLDLRETRRQVSQIKNWTQLLTSERGLWPTQGKQLYRLDETEGPHRMRIKLEPNTDQIPSFRADVGSSGTRDVQAPQVEEQQTVTEVPPWAELYEISSMEMDEPALAEDVVEDNLRRIRHELEPGDVIDGVTTIARIAGVDSFPGLLIIGKTHLYMLDGVVESDEGEIIDAHDAPESLFSAPGGIVGLGIPQRAFRWAHQQIAACSEKTFLLRDVALEVYFKDSRSFLLVFQDRKRRSAINHQLSNIISRNTVQHSSTPGLLRTPDQGSRLLFKPDDLATATRKWQVREISNFTYLSVLNQISGRTPSDATQYPVFPWVLSDYASETLDLASPASYRDLGKPMGALTPARREAAKMRYENLESVNERPFHYGTHFSSSMIVCHFLIRLAPFTNMFKTLQGGDWDLPDRLFADVGRTYESAAHDARGDVRELIPEFFTCPEFLENTANLNFGIQQRTGERIHDVKLPPWARDDPLLFTIWHRRALESEYVSENLPAWIDLIWGYKQQDSESLNAFHPLSYEGAINLDEITDKVEKEATIGIIHNFGQTPRKLFNAPHPARFNHGLPTLPLGTLHGIEEDPHLLVQASRCTRDLGPLTPVRELVLDPVGNKVIPCPQGSLTVPLYPHEQIEWCSETKELRALVDHKVVQVLENSSCNCATLVDSDCLVTGWGDYTVRVWKLIRRSTGGSSLNLASPAFASEKLSISLSHIMRIHTDEVVCVAASRTWSIIVSGSKDGSAVIWDLNRGAYVQSIWHHQRNNKSEIAPINLVAINESTGYIATCSNLTLQLHTINARPIASLDLTTLPSYFSSHVASITSLAFHEREYSYKGILATGASNGSITLWTWEHINKTESERGWTFTEVRRMKALPLPGGRPPCITALKFYEERLYHGEESGKCFAWNFPDSD
ncbi:hypothetical protein AGABI1DRAFT_121854 [Agaricus bisporus var. burnettii JB137-S8]|uniref:Beach-domain-containing protein n=1 Tax=Agaricus bisporus var. burnettii (strain JB137-S8 / ATCC MYA-4627 / FGSC 10392) TaxID=597362 RepID=K5X4B9_AGABU|nr:uncharacterized protein AGABI1DRAFT_121854 [Agaricus bisporus var. burnettii JB137-S8]EKM77777.1 hypothetical protein AGABI1DRAFT_121854 [Agaricus bisporus var. burnettii JB137-S8]